MSLYARRHSFKDPLIVLFIIKNAFKLVLQQELVKNCFHFLIVFVLLGMCPFIVNPTITKKELGPRTVSGYILQVKKIKLYNKIGYRFYEYFLKIYLYKHIVDRNITHFTVDQVPEI